MSSKSDPGELSAEQKALYEDKWERKDKENVSLSFGVHEAAFAGELSRAAFALHLRDPKRFPRWASVLREAIPLGLAALKRELDDDLSEGTSPTSASEEVARRLLNSQVWIREALAQPAALLEAERAKSALLDQWVEEASTGTDPRVSEENVDLLTFALKVEPPSE